MGNLGYTLLLNEFDARGNPLGIEYPLASPQGKVFLDRGSLGMDLQFVGTGGLFFAKGQTSDAFAITTHPIVLSLAQPAVNQPALALARTPTGLRLQWPVTVPAFRLQQTPALV
jgi:hypothetical protein